MGNQKINQNQTTPIALSHYEDALINMAEGGPAKSFGEMIRVETHSKNGQTTRKSLWETANPSRKLGLDGFLSYEEAKDKTFIIPSGVCKKLGSFYFEVRNRSDFGNLRYFLGFPLRNPRSTCRESRADLSPSQEMPDVVGESSGKTLDWASAYPGNESQDPVPESSLSGMPRLPTLLIGFGWRDFGNDQGFE